MRSIARSGTTLRLLVPDYDLIETGNPGADVVSPVWCHFAVNPASLVFGLVVPAI
jgi:hypothetical protein